MGDEVAPMGRSVVSAVLCSGLMVLATVGVLVLNGVMFALAGTSHENGADPAEGTVYLWLGSLLAAATASAAVVLYRSTWRPLTPRRWLVVALGCAAAVSTLALWLAFWSTA